MLVECLARVDGDTNVYGMCGSGKTVAIDTAKQHVSKNFEFGETFKEMRRMSNLCVHPLSLGEIQASYQIASPVDFIDDLILYGCFPEVVNASASAEKQRIVTKLWKDKILPSITNNEPLEKPEQFKSLIQYLARNIGEGISVAKLSKLFKLNDRTTQRYLKLLVTYDIVFPISGYKNHFEGEINRFSKYYFTDLGIRNAILGDFSNMAIRRDNFALWENFLFSERRKFLDYYTGDTKVKLYYWKTYGKLELCCLEVQTAASGVEKIYSYRFSNKPTNVYLNAPRPFIEAYPNTVFKNVTPSNCLEFLLCPII